MSVDKFQMEAYQVCLNGEAATFALKVSTRELPGQTFYGGMLMVYSSFGNFCNNWSSTGIPFKMFLQNISREYFMEKCLGHDANVYCDVKTFRNVLRQLVVLHKDGTLSREDACTLLAALKEVRGDFATPESFARTMDDLASEYEIDMPNSRYLFEDYGSYAAEKPDPLTVHFWDELWPMFIAELKAETTLKKAA